MAAFLCSLRLCGLFNGTQAHTYACVCLWDMCVSTCVFRTDFLVGFSALRPFFARKVSERKTTQGSAEKTIETIRHRTVATSPPNMSTSDHATAQWESAPHGTAQLGYLQLARACPRSATAARPTEPSPKTNIQAFSAAEKRFIGSRRQGPSAISICAAQRPTPCSFTMFSRTLSFW